MSSNNLSTHIPSIIQNIDLSPYETPVHITKACINEVTETYKLISHIHLKLYLSSFQAALRMSLRDPWDA